MRTFAYCAVHAAIGGYWHPISCAAVSGHASIVQKLLAIEPGLAHSPGPKSALPLTHAALCGSMKTFTLLLTYTPEAANAIGWEDKTTLMLLLESRQASKGGNPGFDIFRPYLGDDCSADVSHMIDMLLMLDPAFANVQNSFMGGIRAVDFAHPTDVARPKLRMLTLTMDTMARTDAQFELLINELCAIPDGLAPALAASFTADPLGSIHLVAYIVVQCSRLALLAAQTDEWRSEQIIELAQKVQQGALVAIEGRLMHIFSMSHGIAALDALVTGQCKLMVARPLVQQLLLRLWSPSTIWLSRPTLCSRVFSTLRFCSSAALSCVLLPIFALWPPLEGHVNRWATSLREKVKCREDGNPREPVCCSHSNLQAWHSLC